MTDETNRRKPEDPKKININLERDVEYWSETFGVTREQIVTAVNSVGPMVQDVIRYLCSIGP